MFEEGLSYPFKGDNALGRNLIGGLLVAFSWLIIPGLAYYGYLVRVLRDTVSGGQEPPEFDGWGDMIVDGLKMVVIAFVYGIVPFAVAFGIMLFGGLLGGAAGGDTGGGIVAGFGVVSLLIFFLASLVLLYVLPAALSNFAVKQEFGAAFDFDTIGTVLTSSEYLVAWLLPIVVYLIVYVINLFLAITVVGLILVPWVSFYASVVIFQMFGQAYQKALGQDGSAEPAAEPAI
ncbi:MAG: DUF4013 domain-containing protein [Haloarculaceae archaeon]